MTNKEAVQPDVPDTAVIDTEGLDEQIRCEMCRNPMHTDRGCDGNCKYDEKLYEKIMQILDERIKRIPSAQPERCSDCIAHGGDWECDHMHCRKGRLPSAQSERTETHACDLIDRQAAITAIQKAYADTEGGTDKCAVWKNVGLTNALHIMQDLPSAQPGIIRCKDCKYQDEGYRRISVKWLPCMDIRPGSNWYCGSAERRTDGVDR